MRSIIDQEAKMERDLQRAEARREGRPYPPPDNTPAPFRWLFYSVWFVILLGLSIIGIQALFRSLFTGWQTLPRIVATSSGAFTCSVFVLAMGAGFYWLRERRRFIYGTLELGAAAGAAYYACMQLARNEDRTEWALALVGSVYIAVRGYDNLRKWYDEEQQKRKAA